MTPVNVLATYDGMACGMLAMIEAGIPVGRYVAYEIDKYAVQTSSHNFPFIEHKGDVFEGDFTEYEGFDFLLGGSPCTYWSIAQKNNRETEASGLGWELFNQYVRALKEAKPKYFLYENNKSMSKAIRESISETFGFEPICINSALVSAQNRQRLYWCGIRQADGTYKKADIEQPADRGILLKDILEGATDKDKSRCMTASVGRTTTREYFDKQQNTMAYEPVRIPAYGSEDKARPINALYPNNCGGFEHRMFSENPNKQQVDMIAEPVNTTADGKSQTIKAQCAKTSVANICCYTSTYGASGVAEPVLPSVVLNINPSGKGINGAVGRVDAKSRCLTTNKGEGQKIIEPIRIGALPRPNGELSTSQAFRIYDVNGKSVNINAGGGGAGGKTGLYAVPVEFKDGKPIKATRCGDGKVYDVYEVKDGQITIKGKQYPIKLQDGFYIIRKLTVRECMRLQTVPEWYEFPVSNSQAYKMLGNGWTVQVISHLLQGLISNKTEDTLGYEQLEL